ncbi:hypothetical protein D3C85_913690 [compost metagenome]
MTFAEYRFHPLQDGSGNVTEILTRLHDVEVIVWLQLEKIEYLVKHFPVLASNTQLGVKTLIGSKCQCEWSHLDGFGTRAKYAQSF